MQLYFIWSSFIFTSSCELNMENVVTRNIDCENLPSCDMISLVNYGCSSKDALWQHWIKSDRFEYFSTIGFGSGTGLQRENEQKKGKLIVWQLCWHIEVRCKQTERWRRVCFRSAAAAGHFLSTTDVWSIRACCRICVAFHPHFTFISLLGSRSHQIRKAKQE